MYPAPTTPLDGGKLTADPGPIDIRIAYTLSAPHWAWGTAALKPATLIYDTVAAALLLALGIWEGNLAFLLFIWIVALVVLTSYVWLPWALGALTGALKRATAPTELTIDGTGITARTAARESTTEWAAVKMTREVGGCLAFVQWSGRYRLVPISAFSPDQMLRLRGYLAAEGYWNYRSLLARLRAPANEE
jgi:hypothetical protein